VTLEQAHLPHRDATTLGTGRHLRHAFARFTATNDAVWPTILRVALGGVMLPHALQKTVGLFGGFGLSGTMHWFTAQLHMPALIAATAIFLEQAGALALILGLLTRAGAVAIGILMVGAVLSVHLPYGFFMNWSGTQAGEGFEFHLLVLAMVVPLALEGGGRASIDAALSRAWNQP
jgi:putative oxidoreductase